jgi:hypothetical protein
MHLIEAYGRHCGAPEEILVSDSGAGGRKLPTTWQACQLAAVTFLPDALFADLALVDTPKRHHGRRSLANRHEPSTTRRMRSSSMAFRTLATSARSCAARPPPVFARSCCRLIARRSGRRRRCGRRWVRISSSTSTKAATCRFSLRLSRADAVATALAASTTLYAASLEGSSGLGLRQ